MDRSLLRCLYDLLPACPRLSYGNIIGNRIMEQMCLLGHIRFCVPEPRCGNLPHIPFRQLHSPLVHIPEPH